MRKISSRLSLIVLVKFILISTLLLTNCTGNGGRRFVIHADNFAAPNQQIQIRVDIYSGSELLQGDAEVRINVDGGSISKSQDVSKQEKSIIVTAKQASLVFHWKAPAFSGNYRFTFQSVIQGETVVQTFDMKVQGQVISLPEKTIETTENTEVIIPPVEVQPEPTDAVQEAPPEKTVDLLVLLKKVRVLIKMEARKVKLRADGEDSTILEFKLEVEENESEEKKESFKEFFRQVIDESNKDASKADKRYLLQLKLKSTKGLFFDPLKGPISIDPKKDPSLGDSMNITIRRGVFRVGLRAGYKAATVLVHATLDHDGHNLDPKGEKTTPGIIGEIEEGKNQLEFVELASIDFLSALPNTINVRFSGKEISELTFVLKDTATNVYPAGKEVYFEITNPIGDALITKSLAITDNNGEVTTQIKSGRVATTVTVRAKTGIKAPPTAQCPAQCQTDAQCQQRKSCGEYKCLIKPGESAGVCAKIYEVTSASVAIVGAKPSHRGMTFFCERQNVGGLHRLRGKQVTSVVTSGCKVVLADRFSNKVGNSTQVQFKIEAGTIDAQATTSIDGVAEVDMRTQNPLPRDVDPLRVKNVRNCGNAACTVPAKGGYWFPYDCTQSLSKTLLPEIPVEPYYVSDLNRVHNPRDGLVTVIAYTTGEEAFKDSNGNGKFDEGKEEFTDIGEPFVDTNDDGVWQSYEPFVDMPCTKEQVAKGTNDCKVVGVGNGKRDGPNGVWDSDTLIWKKTYVVWSGCAKNVPKPQTPIVTYDLRTCKPMEFRSGIAFVNPSHFSGGFALGGNSGYDQFDFRFTVHDENLNQISDISSITVGVNSLVAIFGAGARSPFRTSLFGFSLSEPEIFQPNGQKESVFLPTPYTFWGTSNARRYEVGVAKPPTLKKPAVASVRIDIDSQNNGGVKGCGADYVISGTVAP